ncbi:hypothetical protein ALC62_12708, partial [Cyphomyrmex costatus]
GAMRFATYFTIVFAVLNFVNALPFPQFDNDGRERLAARDTAYYEFPWFWYKRPIYDDSNDDIVIGYQVLDGKRRSSTVSYVNVGKSFFYIDYDYGIHLEQFRPNSPELPYDDVSITNGYIDALPSAYDSDLSKLNTLLSSVGLADFRTGIRSVDWIDRNRY